MLLFFVHFSSEEETDVEFEGRKRMLLMKPSWRSQEANRLLAHQVFERNKNAIDRFLVGKNNQVRTLQFNYH